MKIKEECGIFGIYNNEDAAYYTVLGLFALQHRGEESAGVVTSDTESLKLVKGVGRVSTVFTDKTIKKIKGIHSIGHTRYSVTGVLNDVNTQPLLVDIAKGEVAVAHNGNLTNSAELKQKLEEEGSIFQTTMDSEIILHLIAKSKKKTIKDAIIDAVQQIKGSFSLLFITKDAMFAVRDPNGIRPLCMGALGDSTVVCSETCALDLVGAKYMGQVHPGEMISITSNNIEREFIFKNVPQSSCIFEMIYFSRPDSLVFGQSVYQFRKELGRILSKEAPVDADMVIPVPDSGVYAALGYAQASGIPYENAITRNHYFGRSFIQPDAHLRQSYVRIKLNPIKNVIHKKRVIIVDDSIVRGTTTRERVKTMREAGVKEVHMRISCPPILNPCFYGIDFPTSKELIAHNMTIDEIREYLNLDSLAFISHEGMLKAAGKKNTFCDACFTGNYPILIDSEYNKNILG
jgi:amidophosphoribosyltransferase